MCYSCILNLMPNVVEFDQGLCQKSSLTAIISSCWCSENTGIECLSTGEVCFPWSREPECAFLLLLLLVSCSLIGICLMFSHDLIKVMQFWQQYHMKNVPCAVHPISRYMMSTCLITGNVNFDHLIKGLSARFLQCKVLFFPL